MKGLIWALVILLLILRQDNWNWENSELVLGFLPVGLFYHACLSVACGIVWLLAVRFAWPAGVDADSSSQAEDHP